MSERWILCGATIAVCTFGLWIVRRLNPVQPLTFALAWTLVVGSFYPLATLFVEPLTWRNIYGLEEGTLLGVAGDYLAFAIGLVAVIWATSLFLPLAPGPSQPKGDAARWRDAFVAYGLLILGSLLYGIYVAVVGVSTLTSTHDLAEKYLSSGGFGPLIIGLNLIICAALWGEAAFRGRKRVHLFRLAGAATIVWALFFLHVRTYAIILILGYLYLFCEARGIALRRVKPHVLLALCACYVSLESYAHLRGSWKGGATELIQLVQTMDTSATTFGSMVGGSELAHPFITAMEVAQYEEAGELLGKSHVSGLQSFVPLALMPNRPPTIAQEFAAEYYPGVAERGGGTAFSLVGEARWNFGPVLGPLLTGALVGFLLTRTVASIRRTPHGLVARLTPYALFLVLSVHRNALTTSLKQLVTLVLPILALVLLADLVRVALGSRRSPQRWEAQGLKAA